MRDEASIITGPSAALLGGDRAGPGVRAWRIGVVALGLILAVALGVRHVRAAACDRSVAALGRCFVAACGGEAWHSLRDCREMGLAAPVAELAVAEVAGLGAARRFWQRPCEHCRTRLLAMPDQVAKREELDMQWRD